MPDIKQRELKMQEQKKQTPWREFVRDLCSRYPLNLYRNSGYISRYPATSRSKNIVPTAKFLQDRDAQYKADYDMAKPFFEQYHEFVDHCQKSATYMFYGSDENSDFTDGVFGTKNAYLTFVSGAGVENVFYSAEIAGGSKNIFDCVYVINHSENNYLSSFVDKGYNIFFSKFIVNCSDIRFSTNLIGCHHCLFCDNLENVSYYIHNKQYTKAEYEIRKNALLIEKEKYLERYKALPLVGNNFQSQNVSGSNIIFSENIKNSNGVSRTTNGANLIFSYSLNRNNNNFYDGVDVGIDCDDFYGVVCSGTNSDNFYNCIWCGKSSHLYYCDGCESCSYCLGCYGLINKQFCIFNKEYSKEERYELANKIFAQMEKDGTLGKFFPGTTNPFYFNDTVAYLIDDSFTKEEVTKEGYLRRDEEIKVDIPQDADVVESKNLATYQGFENGKWMINPEILKKVIKDEKGNYYRIVKMEYDFLMKYGLPLPELHRLERIKLGFKFK